MLGSARLVLGDLYGLGIRRGLAVGGCLHHGSGNDHELEILAGKLEAHPGLIVGEPVGSGRREFVLEFRVPAEFN